MTGPPLRRPPKPPVVGFAQMGVGGVLPEIRRRCDICDYVRPVSGPCCEIFNGLMSRHGQKKHDSIIFSLTPCKSFVIMGASEGHNASPTTARREPCPDYMS